MAEIVENDEAAHGDALLQEEPHQPAQAVRPLGKRGCVILGDQPAKRDARSRVEKRRDRIENLAADILEIDVDAVRRRGLQLLGKTVRLVVDAGIEAERVGGMGAFVRSTGDADDLQPEDLADLPDSRADRAGRAGYHQRFAGLGLADLFEPRPGGEARHAGHAERPGWMARVGTKRRHAPSVRQCIVPPAGEADDPVALLETLELRGDHARDSATHHGLADLDRRRIGGRIAHPSAHVRVERQEDSPQQHLAICRFGNIDGLEPERLIVGFALGALCQNEAAVGLGRLGHGNLLSCGACPSWPGHEHDVRSIVDRASALIEHDGHEP